jgi:hypothetical protein
MSKMTACPLTNSGGFRRAGSNNYSRKSLANALTPSRGLLKDKDSAVLFLLPSLIEIVWTLKADLCFRHVLSPGQILFPRRPQTPARGTAPYYFRGMFRKRSRAVYTSQDSTARFDSDSAGEA